MRSEEVSFYSGGCTIAGTFTEAADPVAAALLITGSGRSDRNSNARLPATARMILKITCTDIIRTQRKRVARIKASTDDVIRLQGIRFNARWWRDFLAYDPRPALARIKVPVLAITGGQDVQVPPEDVAAIGRLAQGPFEGHVTGDLSHLFRPDPASARGLPALGPPACGCRKPMPPGDIRESCHRRGLAAGRGNGPGR